MYRRQKDRRTLAGDRKARMSAMAETKPTASAAKAFIRKAYARYTVDGKYDIKGEIGIGEEGSEET